MLLKNWLAGLARKKSRLRRSTRRQRHGAVSPAVERLEDRTLLAAPTLDIPSDLAVYTDAPARTVSLTGITAGGSESQPLRITASSGNTGVVPHPSVVYSSADSTGSLLVTATGDTVATVTVTVTVEDGGPDGDLNTGADNATFSRTFDVNVVPDWDEDLVAYFPFNGDAIDATGNGHDGTGRSTVPFWPLIGLT